MIFFAIFGVLVLAGISGAIMARSRRVSYLERLRTIQPSSVLRASESWTMDGGGRSRLDWE
ncbi:MAG: hypothetical protein M3Y42_18025 [Actinomycetota bacterium]|nr:hypothetical protein [Actinomycetota bacterium]MDQ2958843.1 hypothetical protein [Actinomycetota bacterium]